MLARMRISAQNDPNAMAQCHFCPTRLLQVGTLSSLERRVSYHFLNLFIVHCAIVNSESWLPSIAIFQPDGR